MANTKKRTTTKATPPEYPLLYVEWEAHSGADGWSPLTETIAGNDDTYLCQSGRVAPRREQQAHHHRGGQMTIAKALITKRVTLRKP